jgi:transposase
MYRIAGIDVHKKKLAVVVSDVEVHGEHQFERCWFGANPERLRFLSQWLAEHQVEEVVMESTALYWKPVWGALERYWQPICQKREGASATSGICIWRRHNRIVAHAVGRKTFAMQSGW